MGDSDFHLTPRGLLGAGVYRELQKYMQILKDLWRLGDNATVALVLEDGQLHFRELHAAEPVKKSKKDK